MNAMYDALALALAAVASVVAATAGFLVLIYWVEELFFATPVPPGVPLIREAEGASRFQLKTRLAYYTDCKSLFHEAYYKYAKHGKPVVIPGLGFRKEVILPNSSMKWALSQPSDRLDMITAHIELNQPQHTMGRYTVTDRWQSDLIFTDLNRMIERISIPLQDELIRVFDTAFGVDTEGWKDVELWPAVSGAIAQALGRVLVGLPLCRNDEYNRTVIDTNMCFVINAGAVGATPKALRPIVARLVNRGTGTQKTLQKLASWLVPLWEQHIATARRGEEAQAGEPPSHLELMARYALEQRPHEVHNHERIVRRFAAMNLATIHQTSLQTVNLLLDVVASDAEFNTVAALRDEADRVAGERTGPWTKGTVSQMLKADSVARESMRLHSFINRSVVRAVVADDLYTPDGTHLPKGVIVSFLGQPAQMDPDLIDDDPTRYDPFRFSRESEGGKPAPRFVSTSPEHLVFGHGKHACPGRFIAEFVFKMTMAHVLRCYDVRFPDEYEGKRPPVFWVAEATMPPNGARLLVRRRV